MMKLTLFVPLIWMLFSTADALKCVQDSSFLEQYPCKSDEQCLTFAFQDFRFSRLAENITRRICIPSSNCNQSLSLGIDSMRQTASLQCCSTDHCNGKDIPYLDEQKPNGLQCYTSYPWSESELVKHQCVGIEDRCIFVNVTRNGVTYPLQGCASASLCEGDTELKLGALIYQVFSSDLSRFSVPECCETSLCNSAPSAKIGFVSMLLGLLEFSVF